MKKNKELFIRISNGDIANESLFAIILKYHNVLSSVVNKDSTITDWQRMTSPTSPYLFQEATKENTDFIIQRKRENKYSFFLRKVDVLFPDKVLEEIIYNSSSLKKENNHRYFFIKTYCTLFYLYCIIKKYWYLFFLFYFAYKSTEFL
jgi:hypothetical protein